MLLKKLLDILKESKLLKEIKDILDEIKMIKAVINDQTKVVKTLQKIVADRRSITRGSIGSSYVFEVDKFSEVVNLLGETKESFDLMESHAKEVEKGVSDPLTSSMIYGFLTLCSSSIFSISNRNKQICGRLALPVKVRSTPPGKEVYDYPTTPASTVSLTQPDDIGIHRGHNHLPASIVHGILLRPRDLHIPENRG